jgi:urease accessory protein
MGQDVEHDEPMPNLRIFLYPRMTMLKLTRIVPISPDVRHTLTLTFDQRQKCRLRAPLDNGGEAGVMLHRGAVLRDGDCLTGDDGVVVRVRAAVETTSVVRTDDPLLFARACYHLGNRHVPLQIQPGELRYLHDHVLDDMLQGMGLRVSVENSAFEPEPGAYAQAGGHGHHHHEH